MLIKDTLTSLTNIGADPVVDPFHNTTINSRINELIIRDEQLAEILQGTASVATLEDLTFRHSVAGAISTGIVSESSVYNDMYISNSKVADTTTSTPFSSSTLAYIYSVTDTEVIFGNSQYTWTYDYISNTMSTSRDRSSTELEWGTAAYGYFQPYVISRMFDGSTCYYQVPNSYGSGTRPTVTSSNTLIWIKKLDNSIVNLTQVLPLSSVIVNVVSCSNDEYIFVLTGPSGSTVGATQWYLIKWNGSNGTIWDSGTVDSSTSTFADQAGPGNIGQLLYTCGILDSDLNTLYTANTSSGVINVHRFQSDRVLRRISSSPSTPVTYLPGGGFYPSTIYVKNGVCAIIYDNKLKVFYTEPKHTSSSSYSVVFDGITSGLNITSNLNDFTLGTSDYTIDAVFKITDTNTDQCFIYTDKFQLDLIRDSSTNNYKLKQTLYNTSGSNSSYTTPQCITCGVPHMFTLQKVSGIIKLFIDYAQINTFTDTSNVPGISTFMLGKSIIDSPPKFKGSIYYLRFTKSSREVPITPATELQYGSSDTYWSNTVLLLKPSIATLYLSRELLETTLDEFNNIIVKIIPENWSISRIGLGTYRINHNINSTTYSVIPISNCIAVVDPSFTNTYFDIKTFNMSGDLIDSPISCFILKYNHA